MFIEMAGIDHTTADLALRSAFAFTAAQSERAMALVRQEGLADGCVLVCTCNRTELWLHHNAPRADASVGELLCRLRGLPFETYAQRIAVRTDDEAVGHLFRTACGMNSQIWGEDQILSQVKKAIAAAREAQAADDVLEKLFQSAVTCAKRIKTTLRLTSADRSVAAEAVEKIASYVPEPAGLPCLIIGSGEMGRHMARLLKDRGAEVTVTLRQYRHGISIIPEGCGAVDYDERFACIAQSRIIIGATASPHRTVNATDVSAALEASSAPRLFFDLAVPRDFDPALAALPGVTLLDMDDLARSAAEDSAEAARARALIGEGMDDFAKWLAVRACLPVIGRVVDAVAADVLGALPPDSAASPEARRRLEKAVRILIFTAKQQVGAADFARYLDALAETYGAADEEDVP